MGLNEVYVEYSLFMTRNLSDLFKVDKIQLKIVKIYGKIIVFLENQLQ